MIDMSRGWEHHCRKAVDYTYFQTFVNVPKGAAIPDVKIAFQGMDDGSRISIYNARYPNGIVDEKSYVAVGETATEDLKAFMVEGMNRIVITQVDICADDNRLDSAHVTISGQNVRVAVEPELPTTVRLLAYSIVDQVRGSATAAPDHYMAVDDKGVGIIRQDLEKGTIFEVVVIDQATKTIALQIADGPAKGRFLAVNDNDAKLADSQDDKRAQLRIRAPLEPALGTFVSLESVDQPGEYLRHQGYVLKRDTITLMSDSLPRRDATFEFLPAD